MKKFIKKAEITTIFGLTRWCVICYDPVTKYFWMSAYINYKTAKMYFGAIRDIDFDPLQQTEMERNRAIYFTKETFDKLIGKV